MANSNQHHPLAARIAALIEPCMSSQDRPPFSEGELVVMVLYQSGQPLTYYELLERILEMFPYYRKEVVKAAVDFPGSVHRTFSEPFEAALGEYALSIHTLWGDGAGLVTLMATEINVCSALSPHLYQAPTVAAGAAPPRLGLLDIPPEVRTMIYELLLEFPKSGIRPRPINYSEGRRSSRELEMLSRYHNHTATMSDWMALPSDHDGHPMAPLHTKPMQEVLKLFQISKLIRKEAVPIFAQSNKFICRDMAELSALIERPEEGFKEKLSDISFAYPSRKRKTAAGVLRRLSNLPRLKKLTMWFDERDWKRYKNEEGRKEYTDPSKYNGMAILVGMCRGDLEELVLEGRCRYLAEFLKETVGQDHRHKIKLV